MEIKQGPLTQLVEDWLNDQARTEGSKATYRRAFAVYNKWIIRNTHAQNALGATRDDVVRFKASLEARLCDNTVFNYMVVVKGFHRYAYRLGKMRTDPTQGIRVKAPRKMHRKKPLNDEQKFQLMASLDLTIKRGRRDRLILLLMLQAGLRCVEVSRLNYGDLYYEYNAYRLRLQRKGHTAKDTVIRLRHDLGHELAEFLDDKSTNEMPMFASLSTKNRDAIVRLSPEEVSDIVTRCMKKAGVFGKQLGPHSLRHTYGCDLVKKGVPLEDIQLLLGHTSPATTMIYAIDAKEQKLEESNPAELLDRL